MIELIICYQQNRIGLLQYEPSTDNFTVRYTDEWNKQGFPLSPTIPLKKTSSGNPVKTFIENLLPEGNARVELSRFSGVSQQSFFTLLKTIGKESTGAFKFVTDDCQTEETRFIEIPPDILQNRIKARESQSLMIWDGKPRLSISGIQQKLPVVKLNDKFGFGEGSLASTHILKFAKPHTNLILNEYISMKLAASCGLKVATVDILDFGGEAVLSVQRFDRVIKDKAVARLHIIDACQALGVFSSHKYEWPLGHERDVADIRDGVSFKKLFAISESCKIPFRAKQHIIQWLIFNLLIKNADAHGKNISFFINQSGIEITPFYDLINIGLHKEYDQNLAMAIGDTYIHEKLNILDFKDLCDDCDIHLSIMKNILYQLTEGIAQKLDDIAKPINPLFYHKDFIEQYKQSVLENIAFLKARF
ncbi:HipA domain-containing protein [Beggiatoa leptomitoformis]|uniref:Type II toxin-antitoxin system HipA family toxin n=1 Tax=Beggiatoa leptomitoformis TaxID=288004 RepID=A0A2N9YFJ6_9GAMM|nr:HipA domain-containing protein [Beggiatoa leptomitoformis]ALG68411.1 type II toxin-antitoxin system HipA family toxin [Beggiatoa leptomitoformis]AUI69262.1 type II toxin-antitoxin system HipA family toxin [Beggiatoa leptomitoformis]